MKRRLEDQDPAFGTQRRIPGAAEAFPHRVVTSASSIFEVALESMQPAATAAGVQYAQVSQTYQVPEDRARIPTLQFYTFLTHSNHNLIHNKESWQNLVYATISPKQNS